MFAALFAAVALAATAPAPTPAAPARPANSPATIADSFFGALRRGETTRAYNEIFAGAMLAQKPAEVQNLIGQTDIALKYYGKIKGWELIRETAAGSSFVERIYLLRSANAPLFYKMQFYKPDQKWTLVNILFNDSYSKTME